MEELHVDGLWVRIVGVQKSKNRRRHTNNIVPYRKHSSQADLVQLASHGRVVESVLIG